MNAEVINNTLSELQLVFNELDQLSGIMKPTEQQKNRQAFLLAKQAMLRSGVSGTEIARARTAQLQAELGSTI